MTEICSICGDKTKSSLIVSYPDEMVYCEKDECLEEYNKGGDNK